MITASVGDPDKEVVGSGPAVWREVGRRLLTPSDGWRPWLNRRSLPDAVRLTDRAQDKDLRDSPWRVHGAIRSSSAGASEHLRREPNSDTDGRWGALESAVPALALSSVHLWRRSCPRRRKTLRTSSRDFQEPARRRPPPITGRPGPLRRTAVSTPGHFPARPGSPDRPWPPPPPSRPRPRRGPGPSWGRDDGPPGP